MGRSVKIRMGNYRADRDFMTRFSDAVVKDQTMPDEWRRKAAYHSSQLALLLNDAEVWRLKKRAVRNGPPKAVKGG